MLTTLAALGINTNNVFRSKSLTYANQYALSCQVMRMVMMIDDGYYAVVSPKDAAKLRKAGFEDAPIVLA